MIPYRPSPSPVPDPTHPVPDNAAADRAALSLASKPITAIFTSAPCCCASSCAASGAESLLSQAPI
jgi:hypothetical protein